MSGASGVSKSGRMVSLDGAAVRLDRDGLIGWMSDWGAVWDRDWLGRGLVESVTHNSGGLGGVSYRMTDDGMRLAGSEVSDTPR